MLPSGKVSPPDLNLLHLTDDVDEAVDVIRSSVVDSGPKQAEELASMHAMRDAEESAMHNHGSNPDAGPDAAG